MRYTIFGESHGPAIGVVLQDVPPGLTVDLEAMAFDLGRRAPGKSPMATARKEADQVEFLSGLFQGKTTGTPLCAVIRNTDQHSSDYAATRDLARPGHADYTGFVASRGCGDYRGGGHFSGRLTAPLVAAGAIAKQLLAQKGVSVGAHILSLGPDLEDTDLLDLPEVTPELLHQAALRPVPVLNEAMGPAMEAAILAARQEIDSIGGVIQCAVLGLPAGVGSPDFGENLEGELARALFAVPAVKGVAFGAGFALSRMRGSQANDPFCMDGGTVRTRTNHNGGINGGISNGMPVVFTAAIKPTPSISQPQATVNFRTGEETTLTIKGRHDPCIVPRAVPVIEAAAALTIWNLLEGAHQ